jgi:hypothetical protein
MPDPSSSASAAGRSSACQARQGERGCGARGRDSGRDRRASRARQAPLHERHPGRCRVWAQPSWPRCRPPPRRPRRRAQRRRPQSPSRAVGAAPAAAAAAAERAAAAAAHPPVPIVCDARQLPADHYKVAPPPLALVVACAHAAPRGASAMGAARRGAGPKGRPPRRIAGPRRRRRRRTRVHCPGVLDGGAARARSGGASGIAPERLAPFLCSHPLFSTTSASMSLQRAPHSSPAAIALVSRCYIHALVRIILSSLSSS